MERYRNVPCIHVGEDPIYDEIDYVSLSGCQNCKHFYHIPSIDCNDPVYICKKHEIQVYDYGICKDYSRYE